MGTALDPHVAWLAEYRELRQDLNHGPYDDVEEHPSWPRHCELEDLISDTPAATLAGVLAQLRHAQRLLWVQLRLPPERERRPEMRAVLNAIATLERLAAEGAR